MASSTRESLVEGALAPQVSESGMSSDGADSVTSDARLKQSHRFRPDVQGLRAIAVLIVVLFHAGVPHMDGGYVGVDVFFVLSGFVITGLLLRERETRNRTDLVAFYGRRARRILPAAALVIIVAVLGTYHWLGFLMGNSTATDGKWAALFLANFRFIWSGTNYLSAQRPPSPLQNYWSLSVEEQFYLVYPTLLIIVATIGRRFSFRHKLTVVLTVVIALSFYWSVTQTESNSVTSYFSPFTHAWELALGGLIAVIGPTLTRIPSRYAAAMTWLGVGGILLATFLFDRTTAYPGSAVALPVLATGIVIAGGTAMPRGSAEVVLATRPFQLLGNWSYSWYLWHWPILIIAAEHAGGSLSLAVSLLWLLASLVISIISYALIENPLRHSGILRRNRWSSVFMGLALTGFTVLLMLSLIAHHP